MVMVYREVLILIILEVQFWEHFFEYLENEGFKDLLLDKFKAEKGIVHSFLRVLRHDSPKIAQNQGKSRDETFQVAAGSACPNAFHPQFLRLGL